MNRVKVPCCTFCNRELNRRFEQNPRHIVERLLQLDDLNFDARKVELLGLWFVKTMLMRVFEVNRAWLVARPPGRSRSVTGGVDWPGFGNRRRCGLPT